MLHLYISSRDNSNKFFKKHKFLRNQFLKEKLTKAKKLKDLKTFHEIVTRFLKILSLQKMH